jgi:molecular chaperone GrpE
LGVQPIPAEGQTFDPNFHQAVQMEETADAPDNTVIGELQRGYKIKDRLLRPAMVRVARSK